jgi:hypothetical protein
MKTKQAGKRLVIDIPLHEPHPSSSGKTFVIASSRGLRRSSLSRNGKVVWVTVNAFYYPNEREGNRSKKLSGKPKIKSDAKSRKWMVHDKQSNRR